LYKSSAELFGFFASQGGSPEEARFAQSVFSMRRELYTVRNKPVKGRISKELSDKAGGSGGREKLQKAA